MESAYSSNDTTAGIASDALNINEVNVGPSYDEESMNQPSPKATSDQLNHPTQRYSASTSSSNIATDEQQNPPSIYPAAINVETEVSVTNVNLPQQQQQIMGFGASVDSNGFSEASPKFASREDILDDVSSVEDMMEEETPQQNSATILSLPAVADDHTRVKADDDTSVEDMMEEETPQQQNNKIISSLLVPNNDADQLPQSTREIDLDDDTSVEDMAEEPSPQQQQQQQQNKSALVLPIPNDTGPLPQASSAVQVNTSVEILMNEEMPKKTSNKEENKDNASVEILTPKQAQREWRRKRRRHLQKILDTPKASFLALLQQPIEILDDDDDDEIAKEKKPVIIDVDEYLGLFKKPILLPTVVSSYTQSPNRIQSNTNVARYPEPSVPINPADEGYYEGSRIMATPEDPIYLSELQQWILKNLEFFSATSADEQMSQSGRRSRAVRGKVGVRCIHCARNLLQKFRSKVNTTTMKYLQWPPGSVSYPKDVTGLYSSCSQRPQLHFESCPYMPHEAIIEGSRFFVHDSKFSLSGGDISQQPPVKRRRLKEGISGLMYYHITCQRIGVAETPGGLRFTRDLSLDPLPLEEVRTKVELRKPELLPKQQGRRPGKNLTRPDGPMSSTMVTSPRVPMVKTPCSNETCQKIIQEALEEPDDSEKRLAHKNDHTMVSDYTFLAIKQMAICRASAMDFTSRGKKTKIMRIGFAGFCCRHCDSQNMTINACRSFSSAPDNLASAISNSFALHLGKCAYTPTPIKQALITLKKSHGRQMQQLPYGSQRKCFWALWNRMRMADNIVEGAPIPEQVSPKRTPAAGFSPRRPERNVSSFSSSPSNRLEVNVLHTAFEVNRKNSRVSSFPVSSNESSLKLLNEAEENWDPAENSNLMTKEDRFLISDYVFLTMRQLKIAVPGTTDYKGSRRNNLSTRMAGMCCMHCSINGASISSGRTFPSAPDNMASAFNTSLYNHMQNCPYLSTELKLAFQDLRRIHSLQCQNLVFGSQRKFFNKVFGKLKLVPTPKHLMVNETEQSTALPPGSSANIKILQQYFFMEGAAMKGSPQYWQCLKCRAVPFEFRAPGAIHTSCPTVLTLRQHSLACCKDGLFLGYVNRAKKELMSADKSLAETATFKELVRCMVGEDEKLVGLFSGLLVCPEDTSGWWRKLPNSVDADKVQEVFGRLAKDLNLTSTRFQDHQRWLRFLQLINPSFQCPINQASEEEPNVGDGMAANNAAAEEKAEVMGDDQDISVVSSVVEISSDESEFDEVVL